MIDNMIEMQFVYDVAFGFMPRKFDTTIEDQLIYDEEDHVPEMYFIIEGHVSIGFRVIIK